MLKRNNARHLYLKFSRKIKNFLLSPKSREFLIFLCFVLIASGFWLLQTLDNEYETELSIPIRLKDVPENVVITSELPATVDVVVKDRGTVLFNYLLKRSFTPIAIDFNEDPVKDNHVKVRSSDIERKVMNQLNVSSRLVSVFPDTIDYIYSKGKSKIVPIKLRGRLTPARQYYISDTIFSPDSVMVYAPVSILDTITAAYTNYVQYTNVSDTLVRAVDLAKVKGAKFTPSIVKCTLLTDVYTEKTVEVPIVGLDFPSDKILRTFPSKVQITFQIGMARFKDITASDFLVAVSYNELLKSKSDKCLVTLEEAPLGVKQIRIIPDQVDFLIEQNSLINEY